MCICLTVHQAEVASLVADIAAVQSVHAQRSQFSERRHGQIHQRIFDF
jgi:hypothetical protein